MPKCESDFERLFRGTPLRIISFGDLTQHLPKFVGLRQQDFIFGLTTPNK
jgi:hypothetical protein